MHDTPMQEKNTPIEMTCFLLQLLSSVAESKLRKRNYDTVLTERFVYPFIHGKGGIPIILGLYPESENDADRMICERTYLAYQRLILKKRALTSCDLL